MRRIQAELEKLGFTANLATASRYLPKRGGSDDQRQRWTTFLRNHRDVISAMDFLVVPTIRFKILFVWFVVTHGRREVLHFNVTEHLTAPRVIQPLREAVPDETSTKFLVHDNDAIFSTKLLKTIEKLGIDPEPTSFGSLWHNEIEERSVGYVHRELLDQAVRRASRSCSRRAIAHCRASSPRFRRCSTAEIQIADATTMPSKYSTNARPVAWRRERPAR